MHVDYVKAGPFRFVTNLLLNIVLSLAKKRKIYRQAMFQLFFFFVRKQTFTPSQSGCRLKNKNGLASRFKKIHTNKKKYAGAPERPEISIKKKNNNNKKVGLCREAFMAPAADPRKETAFFRSEPTFRERYSASSPLTSPGLGRLRTESKRRRECAFLSSRLFLTSTSPSRTHVCRTCSLRVF